MTSPTEKAATKAATKIPVLKWEDLTDIDIALLCATAKGWRPEAGSEIRGRVLAVKIGTSEIDGTAREYPIVFILPDNADADTEAVAVHAFHAVLLNELRSARPEFGDRLFIRALGDLGREAPKGRDPSQIYAVHVTKPKGSLTANPWDMLNQRPS
jgi:hypothetical protein